MAGVRFKRTTGNQFETTINVPAEMVENDRYYTLGDQLLAAAVVGISAGALTGHFASIPWHISDPYLSAEIIVGSALTGLTISWIGLTKIWRWQCFEALPNAVNNYLALAKGKVAARGGNVELTVSRRHRDGNAESGRTINRFGELPVDIERFNEWVQGALVGKSLSVSNWTPKAKLFARPEYDQLLAKMRAGGLIVNLGSNKGNTLTGAGRRALGRHLANYGITPPSPASETDFLGDRLKEVAEANGGNTLPRSGVYVGGQNAG
jgi:hypothetical protein